MGFGVEMSNAEYHAHKAISKSKLDAARKSGRHLYDMLYGPPRDSTAAFDMGTVLHASALPGENADDIAVRMPAGMKKTTKEGKAFVAEHKGKIILNPSDAYVVDQMMLSLREHPFSAGLVNGDLKGKAEQSFFCTDSETGLELKARPDFILDDCSLILDLKTTVDASPKGFQRSVANYRYYCQASHYLDVVEGATGTRPQAFLFIAVEKTRPFSTAVYMADQPMIDFGKQQAREDLNNIAQWIADNKFPGYSERVEEISLPKWMLPKEDGGQPEFEPITVSY
jgi:exodeoxyribonuclease VIII